VVRVRTDFDFVGDVKLADAEDDAVPFEGPPIGGYSLASSAPESKSVHKPATFGKNLNKSQSLPSPVRSSTFGRMLFVLDELKKELDDASLRTLNPSNSRFSKTSTSARVKPVVADQRFFSDSSNFCG
jgi:hypothetical protein